MLFKYETQLGLHTHPFYPSEEENKILTKKTEKKAGSEEIKA